MRDERRLPRAPRIARIELEHQLVAVRPRRRLLAEVDQLLPVRLVRPDDDLLDARLARRESLGAVLAERASRFRSASPSFVRSLHFPHVRPDTFDSVYQLEHWGAVFSRTEDGRIAQRPFGAAGAPRTAYAADITGHVLVHVLYEQVMKRDIPTYEEFFAWRLVENDGRCQGVICWDLLDGGLKTIGAKTIILATGGAGRLYVGTTNAYSCTGDGMALALRMGVALKDMEMMQFHPTTLSPTGVLITEGTRGEGAYLLNANGDRFLERYAPNAMELASRDVISRAEQTEIDEGRGVDGNVLLDMRHLGADKILERLHGTRELAMVFAGVDPIHEPIPVRPGAHYHMGGVDTDVWGKTN